MILQQKGNSFLVFLRQIYGSYKKTFVKSTIGRQSFLPLLFSLKRSTPGCFHLKNYLYLFHFSTEKNKRVIDNFYI